MNYLLYIQTSSFSYIVFLKGMFLISKNSYFKKNPFHQLLLHDPIFKTGG